MPQLSDENSVTWARAFARQCCMRLWVSGTCITCLDHLHSRMFTDIHSSFLMEGCYKSSSAVTPLMHRICWYTYPSDMVQTWTWALEWPNRIIIVLNMCWLAMQTQPSTTWHLPCNMYPPSLWLSLAQVISILSYHFTSVSLLWFILITGSQQIFYALV